MPKVIRRLIDMREMNPVKAIYLMKLISESIFLLEMLMKHA